MAEAIRRQFDIAATIVDGQVRLEVTEGPSWVPRLFQSFPNELEAVTLGKRGRVGSDESVWVEVKGIEKGAQVLSSRVGAMREGLNLRVVSGNTSAPVSKP